MGGKRGDGPAREDSHHNHVSIVPRLAVEEKLAAQAQAFKQTTIHFGTLAANILQVAAALSDQFQQAATRVFVVLVGAEVIRQLVDPSRQQRDLDLR